MSQDNAHDPAKPLDDLIGPGTFVMLMTMIDGEHSSRPITVTEVDGVALRFLVDGSVDWARAIADGRAEIHGTVADNRANTFLAFNGTAEVANDRDEVARLWNPGASAFFEGKDDPNIRVLRVDVASGEYWDGPSGRVGQGVAMVRAAMGHPRDAGDHGAIEH